MKSDLLVICMGVSLAAVQGGEKEAFFVDPDPEPLTVDEGLYPNWSLTTSLESVFWAGDTPAPGLLKQRGETAWAPRLSLSLDAMWSAHWYLHATARLDRGFDAVDRPDGEFRLDELILRYRPWGDDRLNLQIGKFPTVVGSWVSQHDFYDDAFLLPPLPYGQIIGIGVESPASVTAERLQQRAERTRPGIYETAKRGWGSTIWGPSYSSGLAVFGSHGTFDYAFELKNAALSAHPTEWNPESEHFDSPTYSARLGYRPNAAWSFGISASQGPYLNADAEELLPAGMDRGDLTHSLVGFDARWAHRDLILSAEVIAIEYETLEVGDLRSLSWYLQARWKAAPGIWLGGRFGQILNDEADVPGGRSEEWTPDIWRAEVSLGWRVTPDILVKGQYAFTHTDGGVPGPGEHLAGMGIGWRF